MPPVPKLIVLSEQLRGQQFELTDQVYPIGRSEKHKVCINDPTVSSTHCEVHRNPDGTYTVKDIGSTNGTRINGVRVTEQKLVNTDILQIGGVELMYDCNDQTITSQLKTKTNIDIAEKVDRNKEIKNFDPWKSGKYENPKVKLFFKIFIGLLILVVLGLMAFLVKLLKGN